MNLLDTLVDLSRSHRWLVAAGGLLLVAGLAALIVVGLGALPEPPRDGDQVARERAEDLAVQLDEDLEGALRAMPEWAVARLDAEEGRLPVEGTVAVAGPTTCVGVRVTVDADWVRTGDQQGVTVGEVTDLPARACLPAG